MSFSDFFENKVLDHMFRNQAYTVPTSIFGSLHTADPGDTGANEVSGGSYARQSIALAAAASGLSDNTGLLEWTCPAATVVAVGIWDASTAGNHLAWGWLSTIKRAFTVADLTNDLLVSPAHGFANDDRVVVDAEFVGTIPTGLTAGTVYFVVSAGTDDFKVSTTQGGGAVNITAVGNGIVRKVTPKVLSSGDKLQIAIGDLDIITR